MGEASTSQEIPGVSALFPGARALGRFVRTLWSDETRFWLTYAVLQAVLVRGVFAPGMLADNDGISHYGFLRHFTEQFWPRTHELFGFSERFNFGAPYLLYNVPPGLTWVAALFVFAGLSAASALKLVTLVAYLSLGPIAAGLGKHIDPTSASLPRFLALAMMLFSSELFGFEFFFRNGMLNAACALPLVVLGLRLFAGFHERARHVHRRAAALAIVFAALVLVHVLSAYMLAVGLLAFGLARGRSAGRAFVLLGPSLAIGAGLAAFWLVPSLPFAAKEDAAYTWVRDPVDTALALLDGSLVSSYFAGFFPSFMRVSNVGLGPVLLAAFAIVDGVRRREPVTRGLSIFFLLSLVVLLGPTVPFGRVLPGFDRLLWYRFATPTTLSLLLLGAVGADRLFDNARFRIPVSLALLTLGIAAYVTVLLPASRVETVTRYRSFAASYDAVVETLRREKVPGDRVFSEFIGFDVKQPPSVNYLRHLVAVDAEVEEVASWVYENNSTGQALLRLGPFWYNSIAMVDAAERMGVRFIVAGSEALRYALDHDVRFERLVSADELALYRHRTPRARVSMRRANGAERDERAATWGRDGHDFRYRVVLSEPAREGEAIVIRTNVEGWRVVVDGRPAEAFATEDGFLSATLPSGAMTVEATWSIGPSSRKGAILSAIALVALVGLAFLPVLRFPEKHRVSVVLDAVGLAGVVLIACVSLVLSARVDFSKIAFGLREGVAPPQTTSVEAIPGTWQDLVVTGPLQLSSTKADVDALRAASNLTIRVAAFPGASLTLTGRGERARIYLARETPLNPIDVALGDSFALPAEWSARGVQTDSVPGVAVELRVEGLDGATIDHVRLNGGLVLVEAESFSNVASDSGADGFYQPHHPPYVPLGGNVVTARANGSGPLRMRRAISLPRERYEAFVLLRLASVRDGDARAFVRLDLGGGRVITTRVNGADDRSDYARWSREVRFGWRSLGVVDGAGAEAVELVVDSSTGGAAFADVDAIAFVPAH
jgi:hypothetical protein